jgi:hypothetical protein
MIAIVECVEEKKEEPKKTAATSPHEQDKGKDKEKEEPKPIPVTMEELKKENIALRKQLVELNETLDEALSHAGARTRGGRGQRLSANGKLSAVNA